MNVRRLATTLVASSAVLGCLATSACSAGKPAGASAAARSEPASHSGSPARHSGSPASSAGRPAGPASSPSSSASPASSPGTHGTALTTGNAGDRTASVLGVVSTDVAGFDQAAHVHVNLEARYIAWRTSLPTGVIATMESAGITPLIEIEPRGVSLRAVADGSQDRYLRSLADAARSVSGKLYLSFAPEMNGNWYPWGGRPALFIRAWRHVVSVFRRAKATRVSWVWIVHHEKPKAAALLRNYWPGTAWVTWVGLDGYYDRPPETFQSMFGPSLQEMHKITSDPVLISETAAGQLAGNVPAKIDNLFSSVRADHLLGLVWFDIGQDAPPVHQNWNLESRPAALRAFRAAAMRFFPKLAG